MSVDLIRALLGQIGTLAFMAAGIALIIGGMTVVGRAWAGRLMFIGVVLATVAELVTPEWLP